MCSCGQQHLILLILHEGIVLLHAVRGGETLLIRPGRAPHERLADEVAQLSHVQDHADGRRGHHEDGEDGLLCRPGDEAVHLVGTGPLLTLHQPWHLEAVVDEVECVHEAALKDEPEEQAGGVGPPQRACDGQTPLLQRGQVTVSRLLRAVGGQHAPLIPTLPIGHVHGHQQSRRGHEDQLQAPQADVWHGKEVVVADVFAARLLRVAREVRLLVPPDALSSQDQNSYAEDEEDRKPNLSKTGGVFVDAAQLGVEHPPTHCGEEDSEGSDDLGRAGIQKKVNSLKN